MTSTPHPPHMGAAPLPGSVASTAIAPVLAAAPRPARVLGASPVAVYLVVEGAGPDPDVIAIVAERAVCLPVALSVPGRAPSVPDASAVRIGGGGIDLGGRWLLPARWVDPRPVLPGGPLRRRLDEVDELLAVSAEAAGVGAHPAGAVAAGLRGGDPGPALGLLGQGPGLTPAGDDVVAGVAAALALTGRLDSAAVSSVIATARTATTTLSAALLRCAARGEVVPHAAQLLRALCGEGAAAAALDRLLGVGHTTGAALALGLCAGARTALAG